MLTPPIGLSASAQKLKQTLPIDLLGKPTYQTGILYKAAYEAYLKASGYDDVAGIIGKMELHEKPNITQIQNDMKKVAETFAKNFVKNLDPDFTNILVDTIDSHIKNAIVQLSLVIPLNGALACGVGPVTGSIAASNLTPAGTPTGGITIS
jgi:hypothetical protein